MGIDHVRNLHRFRCRKRPLSFITKVIFNMRRRAGPTDWRGNLHVRRSNAPTRRGGPPGHDASAPKTLYRPACRAASEMRCKPRVHPRTYQTPGNRAPGEKTGFPPMLSFALNAKRQKRALEPVQRIHTSSAIATFDIILIEQVQRMSGLTGCTAAPQVTG